MSLDWNLDRNTALPRNGAGEPIWTAVTQRIVFLTMDTGIGDLSAKNAPEFFARVEILQRLYGYRLNDAHAVTAADIRQHIGLATNVGHESRTAWLKRHITRDLDRVAVNFDRLAESSRTKPSLSPETTS